MDERVPDGQAGTAEEHAAEEHAHEEDEVPDELLDAARDELEHPADETNEG